MTHGQAVVDEGVDGADPEDEEAPDQLPRRLVAEDGTVVLKVQDGLRRRRHRGGGRGSAPRRVRQARRRGEEGEGPLERQHVRVRPSHFATEAVVALGPIN